MTNTDTTKSVNQKPVADKAKEAATSVAEEAKARAQGVADNVASEAEDYAGQAKDAAADEVKSVASALRTAAEELRSGSPQERTFSQIAEGLADASDSMRDKDLGEMVGAVSDFARRNPMVFLGSAALIGFAATRFAKASSSGRSATTSYSHRSNYADAHRHPGDRDAAETPRGPTPAATANYKEGEL